MRLEGSEFYTVTVGGSTSSVFGFSVVTQGGDSELCLRDTRGGGLKT